MAKDIYHDLVKEALEMEGWIVTHDPYFLSVGVGRRRVAADFAAEKFIIAEKNTEKILVEPGRRCDKEFHYFLEY